MNNVEAMQIMQLEINDLNRQKELNKKAVAALKLCMRELRCYVKEYGIDLDVQEAMIEATKVLNLAAKEV